MKTYICKLSEMFLMYLHIEQTNFVPNLSVLMIHISYLILKMKFDNLKLIFIYTNEHVQELPVS